jgi:voltage-gated potassium channel
MARPRRVATTTLGVSGGLCNDDRRGTTPCPARSGHDEPAFERWLAQRTERLDPIMAFLGIVFALVTVFELADPGVSPGWQQALSVTTWAIWALFVVDFVAKVVAAPSTFRFLRRHWLAILMLLIPTLRVLRLGALLRLGRALPAARVLSTSYRATGVARQLLRSRTSYLAAIGAVATLAVAQLAWLAERDHDTFETFGDALLWSGATVIAMQGDPVPETAFGGVVMLSGFAVGLVLIASLAGIVGAYLLEDRRERAERE